MIELYRFDARDDVIAPDSGGLDGGGGFFRAPWEAGIEGYYAESILGRIQAYFVQRKLRKVLRRYPHSLYCSGSGYILKRP